MSSHTTVVAISTLFVCIALTAGHGINSSKLVTVNVTSTPKSLEDICVTKDCIFTAQRLLKSMNSEAKPCDDFYEFACGNYAKASGPIPDYEKLNDMNTESKLEVDSRLQRIITDIDELKAPKAFADLKISYKNCMKGEWNGDHSKKLAAYVEDQNEWQAILQSKQNLRSFNKNSIFEYLIMIKKIVNPMNTRSKVLQLSVDSPGIPWNYFKDGMSSAAVQEYLQYMKDVIGYLGVDVSKAESVLLKILSFEIELSKIISVENETYDINSKYSKTTIGELDKEYPHWKLLEIFNGSEEKVVELDEYISMDRLSMLEKYISRKAKKLLYNWLSWRKTMTKLSLSDDYVKYKRKVLLRGLYGFPQGHWRECAHKVFAESPFLLDVLYYGKYLSDNVVEDTTKIFTDLHKKYIELITKADWLKDKTKQHALKIVEKIKIDINRYQKLMLHEKSYPYHSENGFLDCSLAENRVNLTNIFEYFPKYRRIDDSEEHLGYFVKNHAGYSSMEKSIVIGAQYFTELFYNIDRPKSLVYGSFGSVIGHELGHTLDDKNRHFDITGIRKSWWDSKSNETYVNLTQCLVKQYKQYGSYELGLHVNSFKTRNEDVADNVGLKLAYSVYDEWTRSRNISEKQLPGLDYSARQMFWISYANSWCTNLRPEAEQYAIKNGIYSLPKFRVNIPLSNMPEFAKDFQCSKDSKMNPKKRCPIW
ncbi:neprilysin-2-like [Venturia canescens]|uniref:neprilysin-2-like n=1 Tax=Venturia canescens TaxID=32260 RepID=UPI001C9C29C4|nr:neprilysin-2-like [Venturia canescens]XP_043283996.1 neprilysin-2-like [Venturia canescens]